MIKVVIIDDEPLARSIIAGYLKNEDDISIMAECGDGFEAVKAIHAHEPDLIFLDVQMPKLTGFEMLELVDDPPAVIFTTAFDEYALKAFEKNALDYLLKPVSPTRFKKALEKFRTSYSAPEKKVQPNYEVLTAQDETKIDRIVVKTGTQIKIIPIDTVKYLESYDDYVKIHTKDGMYLKNKTMAFFEKSLDPNQFVRIHRSFIIKVDQLAKLEPYEKDSYIAALTSGEKLNISKSGYARLKQLIGI
ncbi:MULTISPECIES: LytTR family DNA-binding domain-containing protein [Sphingobacterium]|uniref:LytTR family transcriptional regulator DNA-binding domain-containing protein n=1 Tax=Sphingobacterium paramultivorum TaxID=2886510 RepID=A0A7G5DY28_9SPHI|nr:MULTISPECIES: LytTR family transcriptional regulator DNA-binding domain-containing protein [Sphingobacterium]MBB1647052.1 DNA-binding response regulator [Sphingobacterium sp. UME9]MCS4163440.1 two-component system LytT family response regulator [Sphingobacterium sp. BIGb0116]QMV66653.1 LytTR family transcriptional regulator DNA-binding domain-containing protein [Sphingobacterium paramultivorum]WET67426.1 MAG: LytTR family transcriptional regulator DNA-binding domain-containing protein [Sphin